MSRLSCGPMVERHFEANQNEEERNPFGQLIRVRNKHGAMQVHNQKLVELEWKGRKEGW